MSTQTELTRRVLRRSVGAAVTIVPSLGEVVRCVLRNLILKRLGKSDHDSVGMDMKSGWQLGGLARVSHAMKATGLSRIRSPTVHATDIKLPIDRVELAAMHARRELTRDWHCSGLDPTIEFVSQQEKGRPRAEREVNQLILKWPPFVAAYVNLSSARVVDASR